MPLLGHPAARSGSGARPPSDQLAQAGFHNPIIRPVDAGGASGEEAAPARGPSADLPADWRLLRERGDESYQWPEERDRYSRYRVFLGMTRAEGAVHIGLGETVRKNRWGRDRKYVVAFRSSGSPQQPLAEFCRSRRLQGDARARRGHPWSDVGRRMYGASEHASRDLPGTLSNSDVQRAGRLSGRLEQGRRGHTRGRRHNDSQPRADPGPATLPDVGALRG